MCLVAAYSSLSRYYENTWLALGEIFVGSTPTMYSIYPLTIYMEPTTASAQGGFQR